MTSPLDDAEDRAIARALDADDTASLMTGVGSADDDMSATDEYREALSYLPFAEVEPTPELEDRVRRGRARVPAGRRPGTRTRRTPPLQLRGGSHWSARQSRARR